MLAPTPAVVAPYLQAVRPALPPRADRWSASAWLLVRDDGAVPLATTGVLGGSQVGARVAYRVNADASRPISLFARASAALRQSASEAAIGVEWRPSARLPVQLAVEQRVRIAGAGRTDLAVFAHGGGSAALTPRLRLDVYGQAGLVGVEERDAFADGAARLTMPVASGIEAGLGVWGGAQPAAARLDIGPTVSMPFRIGPANLRASADWRFRIAGDARPDSGPALTIGVDF